MTKFAGLALRGRDTFGSRKDTGYLRAYPGVASYDTSRLSLWSRSSGSAMTERAAVGAIKALSDAATSLFEIALAAGERSGGMIAATIEVSNGTEEQSLTQIVSFAAVNKAGTITPGIEVMATVSGNAAKATTGASTLTAGWALIPGTNKVTIQVTPASSLSNETVYRITYTVFNHSPQALAFL